MYVSLLIPTHEWHWLGWLASLLWFSHRGMDRRIKRGEAPSKLAFTPPTDLTHSLSIHQSSIISRRCRKSKHTHRQPPCHNSYNDESVFSPSRVFAWSFVCIISLMFFSKCLFASAITLYMYPSIDTHQATDLLCIVLACWKFGTNITTTID